MREPWQRECGRASRLRLGAILSLGLAGLSWTATASGQFPAPPAPLVEPPITSAPAPIGGIPPGYMTPNPGGVPLMPGQPPGSLLVPVPPPGAIPGTEPVAIPVRVPTPGRLLSVPSNLPGQPVVPPPPQPRLIQIAPPPGLPEPLPDAGGTGVDDLLSHEVNEARSDITVIVGRSRIFDLRDETGRPRRVSRVVIANTQVAEVNWLDYDPEKPDARNPPHLLNIFGQSFGTTTLTIWYLNPKENNQVEEVARSYRVHVNIDTADLQKRMGQLFSGADVEVRQVGSQIILEGQVPNAKMMSDVLNLVYSELRLNSGGSGATGAAGGPAGAAAAPAAAGGGGAAGGFFGTSPAIGLIGSGTIVNRVRVPGARQILLRVKIAELNRSAIRQIGVSWLDTRNNAILGSTIGSAANINGSTNALQNSAFGPAAFMPGTLSTPVPNRIRPPVFQPVTSSFNAAGTAVTNPQFSQLFGIFNAGEFNIFLNALRVNGLAKILAEPNLMALDGQPASFQAGGSFPYPVPQAATAGGGSVITIQFAQFGAILQFLPQILEGDVIRLDVSPTFSDLNFAQGTTIPGGGQVPGIDQRNARTVVELRENQTLAIAGLLQSRTNALSSRVPGLGDLPFVGQLFSNVRMETVETELVVLVTPELVEPMEANEVPPSPTDSVLEPNDYEFYFLGRLEGRTGQPFRATTKYLDPFDVMKHFRSENYWVVGPHGHSD